MDVGRVVDITPLTGEDWTSVVGVVDQPTYERAPKLTEPATLTANAQYVFLAGRKDDETHQVLGRTIAAGLSGVVGEDVDTSHSTVVIAFAPVRRTLLSSTSVATDWWELAGPDTQWVLDVVGDDGATVAGSPRLEGRRMDLATPEPKRDAPMALGALARPTYCGSIGTWEANGPSLRPLGYGRVSRRVLDVIRELRNEVRAAHAPWAKQVENRAFNEAVQFVRAWVREPVHMPDVGVADDGEVNFLWKSNGVHVDLGFYGDGTYSYYALDRQGRPYERDDVSPEDGFTTELLTILASVI